MKILLIGFIAFSAWSALSTYIYACKIKGLCDEPAAMQISTAGQKDVIAGEPIRKTVMKEQGVIPNNLIIHFAFDKSEFISDTEADKYFNESMAYLNKNSQARLNITGHTDAIGSDAYNQALGYRRAQSMLHYFENKGLPANMIIIESEGEKKPADNNNTAAGRANNRRAEITINK